MLAHLSNHAWQSAWFAITAVLLAFTLRKNRAAVRFWVWLSPSLKFLCRSRC
ncbi:MAG TPA: hypothetical protein VKU19_05225 [Bryobacteraceae bacterium]|nr:hypothetical protein [Bryobacteraceae bacterium]